MIKFCQLIFLIFINIHVFGQCTYTTTGTSTSWDSDASWSASGSGCSTKPGNTIDINEIVVLNDDMSLGSNLTVNEGQLTINSGVTFTITGNLLLDGSSGATISGDGFLKVNGTFQPDNGDNHVVSVETEADYFNNNNAQGTNISAALNILHDFTITNGTGVSSSALLTVQGDMFLTGGYGSNFSSTDSVYVNGDMAVNGGGITPSANKLNVNGTLGTGNGSSFIVSGVSEFGSLELGTGFTGTSGGGLGLVLNAPSTTGAISISNGTAVTGSSTLSFTSVSTSPGSGFCNPIEELNLSSPAVIDLSNTPCIGSVVLPITLLYFNAQYDGGYLFDWTTLTEENNDYFTIEYSYDGENFIELIHVDGAGNSKSSLDYSAVYERSLGGVNEVVYFRLKQTDYDGSYSYSYIVPVSINGDYTEDLISIYPNPTSDILNIHFVQFDDDKLYKANVYDVIAGEFVSTFYVINGTKQLDVSSFTSGVYLIQVEDFEGTFKFVVE